jgi:two-component system, cell cycle sensor histidine kinase and response regulator CckA
MDAVGRLAGGVAGDFNNVLTVITGYSDLLRAQIPAASPLRRFADEILYAGTRAAALTRQLLTFSSGQQAQPRVTDLNGAIAGMEPMLRRLLGDSVELIVLPGPALGPVRIDGDQIQQAIVNLATNAREAMPNGGKLVLETSNLELDAAAAKTAGVKPGAYVMLAVSDTGAGMDAETRSRLFEPFFTTKEHGKGSGLGLSLVYGTVKQSEGYITVYSQVNCGTIFEICLPRVEPATVVPPARRPAASKGSETILVVEDEEGVRKLVSAVLNNGGYTVIEAANGLAALSIYEKNSHKIDLVLTDVVMPQMNGFELGLKIAEKNPGLLVLYMSGYRDSPIDSAPGEPPKAFLNKPFTPDILLAKVREALDEGPGGGLELPPHSAQNSVTVQPYGIRQQSHLDRQPRTRCGNKIHSLRRFRHEFLPGHYPPLEGPGIRRVEGTNGLAPREILAGGKRRQLPAEGQAGLRRRAPGNQKLRR